MCRWGAAKKGYENIIIPYKNTYEAAIIKDINIYPVSSLKDTIEVIEDGNIAPFTVEIEDIMNKEADYEDFCDIKGQENAKRALEIAAAGNHNILVL